MRLKKSDDRPEECRIRINLKTKQVDFEHLKERKSKLWYAHNMVRPTLMSLSWSFMLFFLPYFIILPLAAWLSYWYYGSMGYYESIAYFFGSLGISGFMLFIFPFLSYGLVYVPGFLKIFPKIGMVAHSMSGKMTKIAVCDVNDGVFHIPMFSNAYLHYEMYGDFNKAIERIEIIEHPFHYMQYKQKKIVRCKHWQAFFIFSRKPKNGMMVVTYA